MVGMIFSFLNNNSVSKENKKNDHFPIVVPSSVATLVEDFSIESEETAKALIEQAAAAIYFERQDKYSVYSSPRPILKHEVDTVYAMMKALYPINLMETLYAAQIVVGHMLGMRKLAQPSQEDQRLGLKLLRLSNDAMDRLEKERSGNVRGSDIALENVYLQSNS